MRLSRLPLLLLALSSALHAQHPTVTLVVEDDPTLRRSTPLSAGDRAADVFVARSWLTPDARSALSSDLEMSHLATTKPLSDGPAILSRWPLRNIPGNQRLRVEIGNLAIVVLGRGASVTESELAAAQEVLPRCVLIGASPEVDAPRAWRTFRGLPHSWSVWARGANVQEGTGKDARRRITVSLPTDSTGSSEPGRGDPSGSTPEHEASLALLTSETFGAFAEHLQGIARDPTGSVYWSWTDALVKTDARGTPIVSRPVPNHHGDLTWQNGRVVVAVNLGRFNAPAERHDSWAFVYDDATLDLVAKHALPQCRYGAGGICWDGTQFVVVTGLPEDLVEDPDAANEAHLYDDSFRFVRTVRLGGGWTRLGIQTAEFAHGLFVFGCYGSPRCVLIASPSLEHVRKESEIDAAYGVVGLPDGRLLLAKGHRTPLGNTAQLWVTAVGDLIK